MILGSQLPRGAAGGGLFDLGVMVELEFDGQPAGVAGRWQVAGGSVEEVHLLYPTTPNPNVVSWPSADGEFGWVRTKGKVKLGRAIVMSGLTFAEFETAWAAFERART